MSRPVLPDTSWYVRHARAGVDPLAELGKIALSRDVAVCGLVAAEVGRGVRSAELLARYRAAWAQMLYVETDRNLWDDTLELAWQLGRMGTILPLQDVHIAVCAEKIGAVILTDDKHFQLIPGIDATDRIY